MGAMTHSGSNCNLGGSFSSALRDDEKRRPSRLSSISFGTRMPIRKKGQRPIFRGVKRKKALCEANELFPIGRCIVPLESHLHLLRKREALVDNYELEGELNDRDRNQAVINGSVNDGDPRNFPLSSQTPDPVPPCNPCEISRSRTGSECSEILKLEIPDERFQGPPRSLSFQISPVASPNVKAEISPWKKSSLTMKNVPNKQPFVLELHQDQWCTHRSLKSTVVKEKGDGQCSVCKIMHHFSQNARDTFLDIEMGFFPLYLLKNLQGPNCEDGSALLEVKDCRFHSTPEFKDHRRLQFDLGSILHNMRASLVAAKIERLRKTPRKNQPQQLWPKLAKSEAAALIALVPPSDLNLDPKLVSSPVTQDYLGFLSARRSWHYHYLGQNVIFHRDDNFEADFDEKKAEAKWADEQIELLKGFIDLNCSNNSDSCDDSSKNGKKILVDNNESAAHEQKYSLEDMRENIKPYGLLTALRCQAHLIRDNEAEETSNRPTPIFNPENSPFRHQNAENVPFSLQNTGANSFCPRDRPRSIGEDLLNPLKVENVSFSLQNSEKFSFSPLNAAVQFQPSPIIFSPRDVGFFQNLQHDNVGSLIRKRLLSNGSASEKQKLRNGGLLWPISTFVMAAKVLNKNVKAKTDDSMKILYMQGGGKGVMTSDNAWGEKTNSFSVFHSPIAVIDQHEYARTSKGVHSSSMEKMANQNEIAISEYSPAFVPASVTDPDDQVLKYIVGDLLAYHWDMKSQKSNRTRLGKLNFNTAVTAHEQAKSSSPFSP